mgnify:CR=1 FL=1
MGGGSLFQTGAGAPVELSVAQAARQHSGETVLIVSQAALGRSTATGGRNTPSGLHQYRRLGQPATGPAAPAGLPTRAFL